MSKRRGARPPPLKICRESQKILKPAFAVPSMPIVNRSQPVILYMQSPKIIHAEAQDFMALVQRLTGNSSSFDTRSCSAKSEILTADHDSTIIRQASDVTMSSQPDESVDDTPWDFNVNQEMESRASPLSPFSPNFLFRSHQLSSPRNFKDLPLFSPDSNNFFYGHFEPMFSPQRSLLNTSAMQLQSPCPTALDFCKTPPDY